MKLLRDAKAALMCRSWQRYPVIDSQPILCYFQYDFSDAIGSRNSHCLANESGNSGFHYIIPESNEYHVI